MCYVKPTLPYLIDRLPMYHETAFINFLDMNSIVVDSTNVNMAVVCYKPCNNKHSQPPTGFICMVHSLTIVTDITSAPCKSYCVQCAHVDTAFEINL